jgi:hypothetical protein
MAADDILDRRIRMGLLPTERDRAEPVAHEFLAGIT